jgi:hypothetical protein
MNRLAVHLDFVRAAELKFWSSLFDVYDFVLYFLIFAWIFLRLIEMALGFDTEVI